MEGESTNCCGSVEWIVCVPDPKSVGPKFSLVPGTSLLGGCLTTESGPQGKDAGTLQDITNGDFISLMLSAENVEKCCDLTIPDGSCLRHYFEVLHFWLMKYTTQAVNPRSPASVQAKCGRVRKAYAKFVSSYRSRPTQKYCSTLFDFLCRPFVWKLNTDVSSKCNCDSVCCEQDGIVTVAEQQALTATPAQYANDVSESAAAAQWNQHHPDWIPTLHMGHDIPFWQSDSSRKKPAVGGSRADVLSAASSSDQETHAEDPAATSHSSSIQMTTRSKTRKRRVIFTEGMERERQKVMRQDPSDESVINVGREIARWRQLAEELGVISNEAVAGILLDLYYAQRSSAYSHDGEAVSNPLARPVALYKVEARSSPRSSGEDMATETAEYKGTAEQHDMMAVAKVKVETDVAQDPLFTGQHNTQHLHHQLYRPVKEEPGTENTASSLQTKEPGTENTASSLQTKEPGTENTAISLQMEETAGSVKEEPGTENTASSMRTEEPGTENTASSLQTEETAGSVKEEPGTENTASSMQTKETSGSVKEEPGTENTARSLQTEKPGTENTASSLLTEETAGSVKEEPGTENTASSLQTIETWPATQSVSSSYLDVRVKQQTADYE